MTAHGNGQHPHLDELAAAAAAAPQAQRQELPFQPVPTQLQVIQANHGGQEWVLLVATTPSGAQGYFLQPEVARQVAGFLTKVATAAASGLTVVGDAGGTHEGETP